MLRIFRQIRQKLMEQNRIRSYLFYAIGEIALVVIGILLALQVNNWNQERQDREASADYEYRLLEDLKEEKAIIENVILYQRTVMSYAIKAMDVLESGEVPEGNAVNDFLVNVYQASQLQNPTPAISTYQELISSGKIGMIGNESLRSAIITYYNYDWANRDVIANETPYRQNIRKLIPNPIQSHIRAECGDQYTKVRKSLKALLPEQCSLQFDPELAQETVLLIFKDPSIKKDLRFKVGTVDVRVILLNSYRSELESIIRQFEEIS